MPLFFGHWQGLAGASPRGPGRVNASLFGKRANAPRWRRWIRPQPNVTGNKLLSGPGLFCSDRNGAQQNDTKSKHVRSLPDNTGAPPSAGSDSSLTGAYLNQFNEMVKLIEKLPNTPELIENIY
jgi:hypothetical protein